MKPDAPKGVIVAGGATSQLLGIAIVKYFEKQGTELELYYEPSPLAHTKDFAFKGIIRYQQFYSIGRLDRYFPKQFAFLLKPTRHIHRFFTHVVKLFGDSSQEEPSNYFSCLFSGRIINIVKWNPETGMLYGEIWAGIVGKVAKELELFFEGSNLENPFGTKDGIQDNISIHYRLGDMRTDRSWRKSHGVLDPTSICERVVEIQAAATTRLPIIVYSDEPEIAKLLMESAGMMNCQYSEPLDIWGDIKRMSNSTHFIGSFSTVSLVVAEIRTSHGLSSNNLPLNCRKYRVTQELENASYFEARILPVTHQIYKTILPIS